MAGLPAPALRTDDVEARRLERGGESPPRTAADLHTSELAADLDEDTVTLGTQRGTLRAGTEDGMGNG